MEYRFKVLAFILLCTLCFAIPFLTGCADPNSPDNLTDQIPEPGPPGDTNPAPPDPLPDPTDPVLEESTVLINFQSAVEGIIAEGFSGAGISAAPGPGQLNAAAWSFLGFSDGDLDFGGEASAGDLARGTSAGSVSTGGLYAFTVEPDNTALGIQPTSTDFAPGSVVLRLAAPSDKLQECLIACEAWTLNDQDRSTVWSGSCSTDGTSWIELDGMGAITPAEADETPAWSMLTCAGSVALANAGLNAGDPFYLRWDAVDGEGDGSRDESAFDNIAVTFTYEQ
jgi:trimeric autotransporter adhesin